MKRSLLALAALFGLAATASAQYPYHFNNGYAIPTLPQLPGTYMSGPGYIVGGGYGNTYWSQGGYTVQSYNPYYFQQQQLNTAIMQRQVQQMRYGGYRVRAW